MVELPEEEALGANGLQFVIIKEAVCKDDEVSSLVNTVDKENVAVDEKVPEMETESENEVVWYLNVVRNPFRWLNEVEGDLVVVKLVMVTLLVTVG